MLSRVASSWPFSWPQIPPGSPPRPATPGRSRPITGPTPATGTSGGTSPGSSPPRAGPAHPRAASATRSPSSGSGSRRPPRAWRLGLERHRRPHGTRGGHRPRERGAGLLGGDLPCRPVARGLRRGARPAARLVARATGDRDPAGSSGWRTAASPSQVADRAKGLALRLRLRPDRGPVLQGPDGVSRKSSQEGFASLYYSLPRLSTEGELELGGKVARVHGQSWMDKEFGSSQLAPDQAGWDWFALRLADGRDLMLYVLRDKAGGIVLRERHPGGPRRQAPLARRRGFPPARHRPLAQPGHRRGVSLGMDRRGPVGRPRPPGRARDRPTRRTGAGRRRTTGRARSA